MFLLINYNWVYYVWENGIGGKVLVKDLWMNKCVVF